MIKAVYRTESDITATPSRNL